MRSRRRAKAGKHVLALRTFSKIYGLAALRIGYGVGPAPVIAAIRKVQRAFDVTTPAQEAALASLDGEAELARRRAANRESMVVLEAVLRERGFEPIGPAAGNFLFVDVGADAAALNDTLAPPRSDRAADGVVRGAVRAAHHRRDTRGDRLPRRAAGRGVLKGLTVVRRGVGYR